MSNQKVSFSEFVNKLSGDLKPIAHKINDTLLGIQPKYQCKLAWGGWAYHLEGNYSCLLVPYDDHIKLMIMRGRMLTDTDNRLEGSGSNTQHIKFFSVDDVEQTHLKHILDQQFTLFASGIKDEEPGKPKEKQPMPKFVEDALFEHGVMNDYKSRPAYQQNDYLGWINSAKQDATKQKRLDQMLDELKAGGIYMNMPHGASKK